MPPLFVLRALCVGLLLCSLPVQAQEAPPDEPGTIDPLAAALVPPAADEAVQDVTLARRLGYRVPVDGTITALTWGYWFGTEALKPALGPATCRWCAPNALDWGVRNAVLWADPGRARLASDVMLFGVAPLAALGTTLVLAGIDGRIQEVLWDALLIIEAIGIASALNQTVKFLVARERPFVHALAEADKPLTSSPGDNNMSFYSGHAAATFAMAAATATVARMRGRTLGAWAWAVGLPLATATAYLRLAGDKHYLTDVTVGAVMGTAVGILVPALHDLAAWRRGGPVGLTGSAHLVPLPGGAAGMVSLRW
jgi:membrane-associated phospholipid phosphatase